MNRDEIQNTALECLKKFNGNFRAGLAISMGVGKTLICLKYIDHFISDKLLPSEIRILVVAPKLSIHDSWKDEMGKHGLHHLSSYITFTTYISLVKRDLTNYDLVILDECHNLLERHETVLSAYKGSIIGVTGTPPKYSSSEKGKLVAKYCPMIFNYTVDDAVTEGILNDYEIYVHMLQLDNNKTYYKETKKRSYYTSEAEDYNYWCNVVMNANPGKDSQIKRIMRMKALMGYPSKEKYAKELFNYISDKVILFANTKEQASRLCSHSYYSGNKESALNLYLFKSGEINKLSCVLQLNEGVNIPDLKQGIIMHSYGNERKSSQRLGRLLRLNPNEKGKIHILCYMNTIDEEWVKSAIESYDPQKIKWVSRKK